MIINEDSIYGLRIVPHCDKNGIVFGGFDGIVISCPMLDFYNVEISKMVKNEE